MKRACAIPLLALLLTLAGCSDRQGIGAVMLKGFPTLQQTTDYTCGCVSAQMVMQYFHVDDETEEGLAEKMHTHVDSRTPGALPGSAVQWTDYGTSVEEMHRYFDGRGDFGIVASSFCPDSSPALLTDTARVGIQAVGNAAQTFADYGEAARFLRQQLEADTGPYA